MSDIIFIDKTNSPDEESLNKALGETSQYWVEIKEFIGTNFGEYREEWKFYSAKYGWTQKVLLKKRNLLFFTPVKGYFRLAFVFGDKAVLAVEKSDLPGKIKTDLGSARKYMEGRGIQLEVKNSTDVKNVFKLLEIKVNN